MLEQRIDAIRISLASPEQIRAWSWGEVKRAETLNHRTLKPEKGGLFCERIFGPTKDWSCACGKFTRRRSKGIVCDKCGVEVGPSSVRRERLGHIELAAPVAHPWFSRGANSIALLLGLSSRELRGVLTYSHYIVTRVDDQALREELQHLEAELAGEGPPAGAALGDPPAPAHASPPDSPPPAQEQWGRRLQLEQQRTSLLRLKELGILQEDRYRELRESCGPNVFSAGMGAEAVRDLLERLDLDALAAQLRREVATLSEARRKRALKRLEVVEALRASGTNPAWMILVVLPVLPPALRPVVSLDGGRLASSDLNELYQRVIVRNERVKHLLRESAPQLILRNEQRLLQEAVDALFDNRQQVQGNAAARGRHSLRSLSDALSGKMGRFRRNLLGKRVDYSGRSVIVVGPTLKLHQCGLPKKIALELFKPFVMRRLVERDFAFNIKSAMRFVEQQRLEVWDVLEEVIRDHPVLLNRAPTLHRLGIQAFEPVLVEGSAIQLHPLVCAAFNADFDGDQMAVHVPLSQQAREEARTLLLSTANLLSPAAGEPSIGASGDMVLGCFYLTEARPGQRGEGRAFTDATEARLAYEHGVVGLQALVRVRLSSAQLLEAPPPQAPTPLAPGRLVETTVGRLLFNEVLPASLGYRNYPMKKEHLKQLITECYRRCGPARTAELADEIKRLGFTYATKAGMTIAMSDIKVPTDKQDELARADARIAELDALFSDGLITGQERSLQAIDVWNEATDHMTRMVEAELDPYGAISTIAQSGATKAKFQQIRQLSGMRGLMASPSGKIIDVPIRGSFIEGLSVLEYFISSHGARKGLADTALRTAESGYLTRRLVDVAQVVVVTEEDCGTGGGVLITEEESRQMGLPDLRPRLLGRILAAAIDGVAELRVGDELTEGSVDLLQAAGVEAVRVRSPLSCQAERGVCRRCYGTDLATGRLVERGAAVGVIAAQTIGEPGTQLTLRTFHSGGTAFAQGDITQGLPRIIELFEARAPKEPAVLSEIDGEVEIVTDEQTGTRSVRVISEAACLDEYPLPAGSSLLVSDGQRVGKGALLARLPSEAPVGGGVVRARLAGEVRSAPGQALAIRFDEREERLYPIPHARRITVQQGQRVRAGAALTDGSCDPQDVLRISGQEAVQMYLLKEVQRIYRATGVYIHDKHVEVIVRQMLRRVLVEDPGDSPLIPGQILEARAWADANARLLAEGGRPATARVLLLGITREALEVDSFLAAASFQNTKRVLTQAALAGQTDRLRGLKENVILGQRIPAGSGLHPLPSADSPHPTPAGREARAVEEAELPAYAVV